MIVAFGSVIRTANHGAALPCLTKAPNVHNRWWSKGWLEKRQIKEQLYEAQDGRCANRICRRRMNLHIPLRPESAELDHIKARSRKGKDELSNYQLLCRACNGSKGNRQSEAFERKFAEKTGMLYLKK